ncbi:MAG: flippase-like domain-containing protein [Nitrospiraceae bacterium]|nr:flippase-like domain-containing protein [Nitrospiraceae bacterium]
MPKIVVMLKKSVKILLYSIVLVPLVLILLRLNIKKTISILITLNWFYLTLYVFVVFLSFIVITFRWIYLVKSQIMSKESRKEYGKAEDDEENSNENIQKTVRKIENSKNGKIKKRFHFDFFKFFKYRIIAYAISYITPFAFMGGGPVRAWFIRKRVPFDKAMSATLIDKFFDFIVNITLLFIAFFVILFKYAVYDRWFIGISLFFIIVGSFFVFFVFFRFSKGKNIIIPIMKFLRIDRMRIIKRHLSFINNVELQLVAFFKYNKRNLIVPLLYSFVGIVLMYFEYLFLLYSMNISHFSLFFPITIIVIIGLSFMIPIPAALGSLELFVLSFFMLNGMSLSQGLALVLIVRFKDISISVLGIILLMHTDFRFSKLENIEEKWMK